DGFDRVWRKLEDKLDETLVIVISKSGGTKDTRNGMVEAEVQYRAAGLDFARHAVAVTAVGSELDRHAKENDWLARFPMHDWVGGKGGRSRRQSCAPRNRGLWQQRID